jgi:hypothetical protein
MASANYTTNYATERVAIQDTLQSQSTLSMVVTIPSHPTPTWFHHFQTAALLSFQWSHVLDLNLYRIMSVRQR